MPGIRLHPRRRARAIASRGRRARGAREGGVGPALDERAYDSGGPRRARGLGPPQRGRSIAEHRRRLGLGEGEWATRAPSLEGDIAAAAMGLDARGHSRVLYGCLEPLGEDPRSPERETDPGSLRSLPYFDEPWIEWSQFVAANAILDTAFTVMIEACVGGSVAVLQHRLR